MLKIKNNINLKKLEYYGFEKVKSHLFRKIIFINQCHTIQNRIFVYEDLHIAFGNINKKVLDTLYDLIKENIIEKEEEIRVREERTKERDEQIKINEIMKKKFDEALDKLIKEKVELKEEIIKLKKRKKNND